MSTSKKIDFTITQVGETWNAAITRRVSSRNTSVAKQKKGFETEELAITWAKAELELFAAKLVESNKRKNEKRLARDKAAAKVIADEQAYKAKRIADKEAYNASIFDNAGTDEDYEM